MSEVREPPAENTAAGGGPAAGETIPTPPLPPAPPEPWPAPFHPRHRDRRHPPSIFWPVLLIGIGVILLLWNLGYLPSYWWATLLRFWPVLLVLLGIEVLVGRRSTVGSIVSGVISLLLVAGVILLVVYAAQIPILAEWTRPAEVRTQHIEYSLEGVEQASVYIEWSSPPGRLSALGDSTNLIEGDIAYRGEIDFDVERHDDQAEVRLERSSQSWFWSFGFPDFSRERWEVQLSPQARLALDLDTGSGSCDLDLSGLQLSELVLDSGSGSIRLTLPAGSSFEARIDSGSGSVSIALPSSVGVRVELDSGSGSFNPSGRFRLVEGGRHGDGAWESDNYRTAASNIVLRIDQGSGSVTISDM